MKYAGKKLAAMAVTILLVSFFVFLSFEWIKGDPAQSMLGMNATPEKLAALREEMGLNDPFFLRYFRWLAGFVTGNLGTSYSYGLPVSQMIAEKIPITLAMTFMAFGILLVLAIPLGVYAAKKENRLPDRIIYALSQITMAVPPFFMGILLTFLFGLVLHWFTPGGYISYEISVSRFLGYLFFPALAIALPKVAMTVKLLRTSILEQKKADYVRTAYSRGNNTNQVLYRHMLPNALIPTITFLGMVFADMMAASIIVEQVFGVPGLGRILLTSIANRDYPVVQGVIVWIAAVVVITNCVVDILYRMADPRMRIV